MPFLRNYQVDYVAGKFDFRNVWKLETGRVTRTLFTYPQFARNCRELKYFGYRYIGMSGYIPRYMDGCSQCIRLEEEYSFVCGARTVYPECIRIEIEDERFAVPEFFRTVTCSRLQLDFIRQESGERVFLNIEHEIPGWQEMWLSKSPVFEEEKRDLYRTYITYHFETPVFQTSLETYGLL